MVLRMFEGARDVLMEHKETGVTADFTGKAIHMPAINECNTLVEVQGLEGDAALSIRFEESENGTDFNKIGTFPIPERRHGILFAKEKDYVRYVLLVNGAEPNMDVTIKF